MNGIISPALRLFCTNEVDVYKRIVFPCAVSGTNINYSMLCLHPSLVLIAEIQFKLGHPQPPESVCSLECELGQAKKYVEGESCCWHCFNCTQYQVQMKKIECKIMLCACLRSFRSLAPLCWWISARVVQLNVYALLWKMIARSGFR